MNKWNAFTLLTLFASLLSLYYAWQVRRSLEQLIRTLQELLLAFRQANALKETLDNLNAKVSEIEKAKPAPIITPGPGRIQ